MLVYGQFLIGIKSLYKLNKNLFVEKKIKILIFHHFNAVLLKQICLISVQILKATKFLILNLYALKLCI